MTNQLSKLFKKNTSLLSFLFLILLLRISLPYISFSSSDLEGLSIKYLYIYNSINIYDIKEQMLPLPYFPFVLNIYLFAGKIGDFINLNYVFILKYIALFFEFLVAGAIIAFYRKEDLDLKKSLIIASIFLINPLTIYITSFWGFFETSWIFFLLLTIYIYEFEDKNTQNIYIPIFLAISIAIKPISLFFLFYFYYKNSSKILFLFIFALTSIILNIFFIIGNLNSLTEIFELFKNIFFKFSIGTQNGEFGISEIEKLYNNHFDNYSYIIFKIIKLIELVFISFVYFFSLNTNKIKSYEFIFSVFFIVFLLNDNLHANYLYWIIPFSFLINFKKAIYAGILITIVCFSSTNIYIYNYNIFNFLSSFSFLEGFTSDLKFKNYSDKQFIFNILIYYSALLFLFDKKIFKKMVLTNNNYLKIIKKILLKTFEFKKINRRDFKIDLSQHKFNIYLYFILALTIFQLLELKNITESKNKNFDKLLHPPSLLLHETHGQRIEYITYLKLDKVKNLELSVASGYFSTVYINNEKVSSSSNILNYIWNRHFHERSEKKIFPLKKIKIKNKLKIGNNQIKVVSNTPHSLKEKFGLILFLFNEGSIFKSTEDFSWQIKFNEKKVSYIIEDNVTNNFYYQENNNILDNYLSLGPEVKILNYNALNGNREITSRNFMIFIFFIIFIINIFYLKIVKRYSKFK